MRKNSSYIILIFAIILSSIIINSCDFESKEFILINMESIQIKNTALVHFFMKHNGIYISGGHCYSALLSAQILQIAERFNSFKGLLKTYNSAIA